ncbi:hypothetical protein CS053_00595 [Rhodanobacter glycinis]|uniref:Uncharacterized protein n=1 Tax=Rhodanobacter glycinis TaxID=582702 RepID=A0A5B9DUE8_9GAMM|nr:hypothetical protein [Rhodanobacter glycinis]QEE23163.1 hypothetical protein CS053_00595 [Rhodanobacter glycinis]
MPMQINHLQKSFHTQAHLSQKFASWPPCFGLTSGKNVPPVTGTSCINALLRHENSTAVTMTALASSIRENVGMACNGRRRRRNISMQTGGGQATWAQGIRARRRTA